MLAIETSSAACSAALWLDGQLRERLIVAPNRHSRLLLPMIEELLSECEVTLADCVAVAFGRGPGSFTGVRLASAVAQGLAYGAELPTVPVCTLDALAQRSAAAAVLPAVDARMNQVYWACYRRDDTEVLRRQGLVRLDAPEDVTVDRQVRWTGVGSGWDHYPEGLSTAAPLSDYITGVYPRAAEVARIAVTAYERGEYTPPLQALPEYIRNEVAARPVNT